MIRTLVVLVGAAAVVATVDLTHKAIEISERGGAVVAHDRSGLYAAVITVAAAAWAAGVVLTRSPSIALAAGIVLGGGVGNLVSIALWPSLSGVPNPLVAGVIAFNVADVAVSLGLVSLIAATLVFTLRNRDRLFEPVRLRS